MSVSDLLQKLPAAFNADEAAGIECTIQFNISQPMYATIKSGACSISHGTADQADVTLTVADGDLEQLLKGQLNGMTAFITGKLRLDGDVMLAQRISDMFDASKLG